MSGVCRVAVSVAKAPTAVAPAFTATPSIHQIGDGVVEFEVRLTSCPAPSVQWYKGSTAISDGGRYRAVTHTDGVNYTLSLTISGVTNEDAGAYKVIAKTAAGESNANITLNLAGSTQYNNISSGGNLHTHFKHSCSESSLTQLKTSKTRFSSKIKNVKNVKTIVKVNYNPCNPIQ